jgi:NADPH:quinone reductase-like Zn-dependent oxidoreductase
VFAGVVHGATVLLPAVSANLVAYVERGEIRPVIARTFGLADLAGAH